MKRTLYRFIGLAAVLVIVAAAVYGVLRPGCGMTIHDSGESTNFLSFG